MYSQSVVEIGIELEIGVSRLNALTQKTNNGTYKNLAKWFIIFHQPIDFPEIFGDFPFPLQKTTTTIWGEIPIVRVFRG